MFAFYNISWQNSRFEHHHRHEQMLTADIRTALGDFQADAVLLSECGEIGIGLDATKWLEMLRRICSSDFAVCHQSHYTSIVRLSTM